MRPFLAILAIALLAVPLAAQAVPLSGSQSDVGGMSPLTAGTTYHVVGDVSVPTGQTLTVPPGVIFKMGGARSFVVNGTLICGATGGAAVYFTSDTDDSVGADTTPGMATAGSPGHWRRISMSGGSDASVFENTVIRFGGNSGFAALVLNNSDCTLTDCTVENNQFDGATLTNNSFPTVSGCAFTNNGGWAVQNTPAGAVTGFTGNTSSGNGALDELRVTAGNPPDGTTWTPANTMNGSGVIVQAVDITIVAGESFTLAAGMIIKWEGPRSLIANGTLTANGTAGSRVYFTSLSDDSVGGDTNKNGPSAGSPGNWRRLRFTNASDASMLIGVTVSYAGNSGFACIELSGADITMLGTRVENGQFDAINLTSNSFPTISKCLFLNNGGYCMQNTPLAALPGFSTIDASGNGSMDEIRVLVGSVPPATTLDLNPDMTMGDRGVIVMAVDITVPVGTTLRLAPGMTVKWEGSRSVSADGTFEANGLAADPVVFTSLQDDTEVGDTNKNGPSAGSPGNWRRLRFTSNTSVVSNARVKFAGNSGFPALELTSADISLTGVSVQNAQFAALNCTNNSAPTVTGCSFTDCGGTAIINVPWASVPGFTFNTATGNLSGDYMLINSGVVSGSVTVFPYNYPGDVLVSSTDIVPSSGNEIVFEAGCIVKFTAARSVGAAAGGSLQIRGTGLQPVVFTAFSDDSEGGDTNLDGGASTPIPGSWRRLSLASAAGPCNIQHARLKYGGNAGFAAFSCLSPTAVINAVRVEQCQFRGFELVDAASPVTNLVAWDCGFGGIDLNGSGSFDLLHATVADCVSYGIRAGTSHMGAARNCNSWGNTTGNYVGFPMGMLSYCNGDTAQAGMNGNTNMNPLWMNGTGGDLRLQPTSPSIDAAQMSVAMNLITDHNDNSRIADHDLDGTAGADQGAYECAAYSMSAVGAPTIGGTVAFTVTGAQPGAALYFAGILDGSQYFDPFGFVSVGSVPTLATLFVLPTGVPLPIPFNLPPAASGIRFGVQALCVTNADPTKGTFTNRYVGVIF